MIDNCQMLLQREINLMQKHFECNSAVDNGRRSNVYMYDYC